MRLSLDVRFPTPPARRRPAGRHQMRVRRSLLIAVLGVSACGAALPDLQLGARVPADAGEVPNTRVLVSLGQSQGHWRWLFDGIEYTLGVDRNERVQYMATSSDAVETPDGVRVGFSFAELQQLEGVSVVEWPGWGYVANLPSGWKAAFFLGLSMTDRPPQPDDRVELLFRGTSAGYGETLAGPPGEGSTTASVGPPADGVAPRAPRDWLVGSWHGVRRDGADGSAAPMTSHIEAILGGAGLTERIEVTVPDGVYRGFATEVFDPTIECWVRMYVNATRRHFTRLEGEADGAARVVWRSVSPDRSRETRVVTEPIGPDRWRRTSSVSENGGKTWRLLFVDELERAAPTPSGARGLSATQAPPTENPPRRPSCCRLLRWSG